ncbi:hypothetical protein F5876DRAFT_83479 [Lentinula aff. lateritia]|uniref:Uncharacterized protein n=1 Tax=Lentinula aff. lateritia TaxID=2804960 RepID=A0ACC1THW1_9AGAR|nr:hypothetical protein F5876DRAFT_83479 [Lentinula aff. lateritia]
MDFSYSLFLYLCFSTTISSLRSSKQSNTHFYLTFKQSDRPPPNFPQAPQVLHELRDLDLVNVEAIPYVELRIASLLIPPTLEDVCLYLHFPGPPSQAYTPSGAPMPGTHYIYDLSQSGIVNPIYYRSDLPGPPRNLFKGQPPSIRTTLRSFPSLVAVPVAPFELQLAPSTLHHKPLIPKPTLRPILTQVLQAPTFVAHII